MSHKQTKIHQPICPKCGYDQSGEIFTWTSQCPLQGTCPECGLELLWADVFDPSRVHLSWYIEHTKQVNAGLRRIPSTLWKMLIPNRFWKRLTVQSPVYPHRLWAWIGAGMLALYMYRTVVSIALNAYSTFRWNQLADDAVAQNMISVLNAAKIKANMTREPYWIDLILDSGSHSIKQVLSGEDSATQFALIILAMVLIWTLIMTVVPATRRIAQLRMEHIYRATALSFAVVLVGFILVSTSETLAEIFNMAGMRVSGAWGNSFSASQTRFNNAEYYSRLAISIAFIAIIVWTQWFWIAAIVRGWRVRSFMLPVLGLITSLLAGFTALVYIEVY